MGQGTLTGLAQLVAEELECDWSKVHDRAHLAGSNLAAKRAWGDMGTGGSRGIRTSQDYVRRGGAAARMMLLQAAADQWKVPVAELTVANGVITHAATKRRTTLRQGRGGRGEADAARSEGDHAQRPEELEDRRQAAEAPRHRRQARRQQALRDRRQAARHAQRGDQGLPGVRRQAGELRRRRVARLPRRQERGAGERHTASRSSPTPGGTPRPRSTRCRSSGTKAPAPTSSAQHRRAPRGGSRAPTTNGERKNGDALKAIAEARRRRSRRSIRRRSSSHA